ncbi:hypothetical protein CKO38_18900, partial [Rhodospirillum rubrum]|nr:hypothetical protein [Rhodospirillum rubrum]
MQTELTQISCTAFVGGKSITKGTLQHVVAFVKDSLDDKEFAQLLIFNDLTGKPIDIDFRGKTAEVLQRLSNHADHASAEEESKQPT